MRKQLVDLLDSCVVRINILNKLAGTGFFVATGYVLTCAHVIEDFNEDPSSIDIYWGNQKISALEIFYKPKPWPDLALIMIDFKNHKSVYLDPNIQIHDELYSLGCTEKYPHGESITVDCEGSANDVSDKRFLKFKDGQVISGFSGAPLLNMRTGGVCGIIKSTRDRYSSLGGRGIPIEIVFSEFEELIMLQKSFHNDNPLWYELRLKYYVDEQQSKVRHVCFVSSEYPPRVKGGLGVHVKELSRVLASKIKISIVVPRNDKKYEELNRAICIELSEITADYKDPLSWLLFSEAAANKIINMNPRPDIIHCHDWMTVLVGIKVKYILGIPFLFHLHLPNQDTLCRNIENLGLICADKVTVSSDVLCQQIPRREIEITDKISDRIVAIPNGVDTNLFSLPENKYQANKDGEYLLFVGRLVRQKGVDVLLHAMQYILKGFSGKNIKLKIVGEGPPEYEIWLKELSAHLNIKDNVEWLGWVSHGNELVRLYQNAKIVVIPSIYEPFGIIALEAMACGRPIVASDEGGLREIIGYGNDASGYLCEKSNDLDFAQWIMTLLRFDEVAQKMSHNGFMKIKSGIYSWNRIGERFLIEYEDIKKRNMPCALFCEKKKNDIEKHVALVCEDAVSRGFNQKELDNLFSWRVG